MCIQLAGYGARCDKQIEHLQMAIFPTNITVAKGRNWGSGVEHFSNKHA